MSISKRRTAGAGAATTKATTAETPAKKPARILTGKTKVAIEPVQPAAPTKPKAWVSGSANPPPKAR